MEQLREDECLRFLLHAVMAVTIHEHFVSRLLSLEKEMGEELFVSGLVGPYRIFQRKKGHRHGIDDAATAWYALQKTPPVKKTLDLGSGIGTVGLAVLWGLGVGAELTCVEAQQISYRLLCENILGNGLNGSVRAIHGDIRDLDLGERFPLITGSPPYFPIGTGSLPEDPQKAHARFELRGDVGDYARAAKRHITDDGRFVFCFPFQQKSRCIKLVTDVGFRFVTIRDVVPMKSKLPLFSLYCASPSFRGAVTEEEPLIVAFENGKYTPEMMVIQATRGFGPEGTNVIA
jgi:tRNA1Val (adenine37-N6)-methyltransferase